MKRILPIAALLMIATGVAIGSIPKVAPKPNNLATTSTTPATGPTRRSTNGIMLPVRSCAGIEAIIASIPADVYPGTATGGPALAAQRAKATAWSDTNIENKPVDCHEIMDLFDSANQANFFTPGGIEVHLVSHDKLPDQQPLIMGRLGIGGNAKARIINIAFISKIP